MHRLSIQQKNPDLPFSSMNTFLFLDGKPVEGCTSLKFEITGRGLVKVELTLLTSFEDAEFLLAPENLTIKKDEGRK